MSESDIPEEDLLNLIHAAALDPARWVDVCDGFADVASARGSVLIVGDLVGHKVDCPVSPEIGEAAKSYMRDRWYERDPRNQTHRDMLRRGYASDLDCISDDETSRSPYYQDFLRPAGLKWFCGIGATVDDEVWALRILRGLRSDPFTVKEMEALLPYLAPLQNAISIARAIGFARFQGIASAFEQGGLGLVGLDRQGRVLRLSPVVEALIGDGLQVRNNRLRAADVSGGPALQVLVDAVCCRAGRTSPSQQVLLKRRDGQLPLIVRACPIAGEMGDIFNPIVAMLIVSTPESSQQPDVSVLGHFFGLTVTEARLAVAMFQGQATVDYASNTGVSPVTVRNQLQAVLRKTGTHRQAELVSLLARFAW